MAVVPSLPLGVWLPIFSGPGLNRLNCAYFGEDYQGRPLPPYLYFKVLDPDNRRDEIVWVLPGPLEPYRGGIRRYNITGGRLKSPSDQQGWVRTGGVEISCYTPTAAKDKGHLRLQPFGWVAPSIFRP